MYKLLFYLVIFWNGVILTLVRGCGIKMPIYVPPGLRAFVNQSVWNSYRNRQEQQLQLNNLCRNNRQQVYRLLR